MSTIRVKAQARSRARLRAGSLAEGVLALLSSTAFWWGLLWMATQMHGRG